MSSSPSQKMDMSTSLIGGFVACLLASSIPQDDISSALKEGSPEKTFSTQGAAAGTWGPRGVRAKETEAPGVHQSPQ